MLTRLSPLLPSPPCRTLALTASNPPVFPTTPLESSLHPTTASNTPSTASSSSSASATVPVLLAVTDYGANNLFANTQFDPDSLVSGGAEAGASGALGDYLGLGEQNNTVIPGVVSDAGDISVEGIPTGGVGSVAAVEGGGRGSKRSSSNAGGGEGKEDGEGDEGSGGDANSKPLKNTSKSLQSFSSRYAPFPYTHQRFSLSRELTQVPHAERAAQNRAAQRAFRERKEQHVRFVLAFPTFLSLIHPPDTTSLSQRPRSESSFCRQRCRRERPPDRPRLRTRNRPRVFRLLRHHFHGRKRRLGAGEGAVGRGAQAVGARTRPVEDPRGRMAEGVRRAQGRVGGESEAEH